MKIRALIALLLVLGLLFLGGCGGSEAFEQEGCALVIILGNHANANRYEDDVITQDVAALLKNAATRQIVDGKYTASLEVSVIISDGVPTREALVYGSFDDDPDNDEVLEMNVTELAPEKCQRELNYLIADIQDILLSDGLRATDEGANLPAAIREASRILHSSNNANKKIFIYDSGIVTEGKMAMGVGENHLDIQSDTAINVLDQVDPCFFPDLSGIDIEFYGLADVCDGQKDIRDMENTELENQFIAIWEAFFERCNAKSVNALKISAKGSKPMLWDLEEEYHPYPKVRNVPFYEPVHNSATDEGPTFTNLSASELGGFGASSAEFLDKEQAKATLNSYYEGFLRVVKEDPDMQLYIVGSAAKREPSSAEVDRDVSRDRAIAVSKLIQEMFGIPASQIVEIDAGVQRFSWSDPTEEFPNGKMPTTPAEKEDMAKRQALHRVVTLIPSTEGNRSLIAELDHEVDILP